MTELMVDLETLDTDVHSSVVLSIGLVAFDSLTGTVVDRLCIYPSVREQQDRGRTISLGTVRFWAKQDGGPAAADEAMVGEDKRVSLDYACDQLRRFYRQFNQDEMPVWANGDLFDIGLLHGLFEGHMIPWRYNAVRDLRTVMREASLLGWDHKAIENPSQHSAIGDCVHQIRQLTSVREFYASMFRVRLIGSPPSTEPYLPVMLRDDATWLDFGNTQVNAEALAEQFGGLIGRGILHWCNRIRGKVPLRGEANDWHSRHYGPDGRCG